MFGGTTEGRKLVEYLEMQQLEVTACVATEYGEELLENCKVKVHTGRMDTDKMQKFFLSNSFDLVIDATHPYAEIVSENLKEACAFTNITYLRVVRESNLSNASDIHQFLTIKEVIDFLNQTKGNILLTTGSKDLKEFTKVNQFKKRIYARVLPLESSLFECKNYGLESSHIIAAQGPFTEEFNLAMMKFYDISYLVTKDSGMQGGMNEKIASARQANVKVVVLGRPATEEGIDYQQCISYLEEKYHTRQVQSLYIVGIGMGSKQTMSYEAIHYLKTCDCIIGASRMLDSLKEYKKPTFCSYQGDEIHQFLTKHKEYQNVVIAMSGDVGFYSGAKKLLASLQNYKISLIPGISSVVYFSAKLQRTWENVKLLSLHGRNQPLLPAVKTNENTFVLLSGDYGVKQVCQQLCEYGFNNVTVYIGERLSYPEEQIYHGKPSEFVERDFDALSVMLIENQQVQEVVTYGLMDEEFQRTEVPMTKCEVRTISLSKLLLTKHSIVYDIGAGTGSVAIEAARIASEGVVYAIEKKKEAVQLILENKKRLCASNLEVIEGIAPEVLKNLPVPTHAFLGGTSGNLNEILSLLLEKNPNIRIVINAITIETLAAVMECLKKYQFNTQEIVQISVSKSKKIADYHMMIGQNPVYIITCQNEN